MLRPAKWRVRWALWGMVVAAGAHGCSDAASVEELHWDVIGVVTGAELAHTETTTTRFSLTPEAPLRLLPVEMTLADGTVLRPTASTDVPDEPCLPFMSDAEKLATTNLPAPDGLADEAVKGMLDLGDVCIVIADLARDGTSKTIDVLRTDEAGRGEVGELVERRQGGYLTSSGYVFAMSPDVSIECPGDPVTVEQLLDRNPVGIAKVDPATEEIAGVTCVDMG